jgi:membrane protein
MTSRIEDTAERAPRALRPVSMLAVRTVRSSIEDRVHGLAAEAAFFSLLSIPPLLLAVIGSIGYVADMLGPGVRADIEAVILGAPAAIFTPDTMDVIRPVLEDILREGRGDVVSIGFLIALWAGSRAVNVFLEATSIAYDVEQPRTMFRRRALAYVITLAGSVLVIILVPALVLGPDVVAWLFGALPVPLDLAEIARRAFWPVVVVVTVLSLTAFYDVGVPWETPLRRDLPGAVIAMLALVLGGGALRLYAGYSLETQDNVYGPLATPLVIILYVYVASFAVLIGAELNAEVERLWPSRDAPASRRAEADATTPA